VAILTGRPLRRIAADYGLSEGSARRHAEGCISDDVREAITGRRRDRLADLSDKLLAATERVVEAKRPSAADLSAVARVVEVRARLEGRTVPYVATWRAEAPVKSRALPLARLIADLADLDDDEGER
jgi:hypothetical protein